MDFKKLFKRNKTPDIVGKEGQQLDIPTEIVNKIYLVFPKLDGEPTFELTNKLTVGSELGEVILDDESVAPKHCTLTHTQDVISIMDHGSPEGTYINKKQINAGRIFILQEKDKIKIGNLEARLLFQEEEIPIEEEIVSEVDDEDLDPAVMERMQALASGTIPAMPTPDLSKDEVSETPPELSQEDKTADIEVPDDLTLDENASDSTAADLGVEEGDIDEMPDLPEQELEEIEDELEDLDEDEVPEEPQEKKPGIFAKLFKKKEKPANDEDDVEAQVEEDIQEQEQLDEKTRKMLKASGGKKLKVKKTAAARAPEASNTLGRVFALILEVLIIIFSHSFIIKNEHAKKALDTYPPKIWEFIVQNFNKFGKPHYDTHLKAHVDKVLKQVPAIDKAMIEVGKFFDKYPEVLYGLYLFMAIRLLTPLIFGVSLGQAVIGIKGLGNFALKRFTGVLRELIGFITAPLIIFDLPALFSKRTLKEMLSFSHISTGSTLFTTLLTFFWMFAFVALYVSLPVIERGSFPQPVEFETFELKPMKIKVAEDLVSKELRIKGKLPEGYVTLFNFQTIQKDKKRFIQLAVKMLHVEEGSYVTIKRLKEISLPKLLAKSIEGNYLANWKYPEILKITNDASKVNKNFKVEEFLNSEKLTPEVRSLIKGSYGLSIKKIHHHIMLNGPFLKGYLNFRDQVDSLADGQINIVKLNFVGLTPSIILQGSDKNKLRILTLNNRKANLYELEASTGVDNLNKVIENIAFSQNVEDTQKNDIFFVADKLMKFSELTKDEFQLVYEVLFEHAKKVMMIKDKFITEQLQKSIATILEFSNMMSSESKDKFIQNITDLLKAIKDGELSFFGIKKVRTASL